MLRHLEHIIHGFEEQNTLYVEVRYARATILPTGKAGLMLQTDGAEPIVFELTPDLIASIRSALEEAERHGPAGRRNRV